MAEKPHPDETRGVSVTEQREIPVNESGEWWEVPEDHRSGFVALIGRPNVGKSTLMNRVLGQKVAIVTPKPQTTRTTMLGILTRADDQMIFVDTPGIHKPIHKLGEYMVEAALRALENVDVILWLVDISRPPTDEDLLISQRLDEMGKDVPMIMAGNKMDLVPPDEVEGRSALFRPLAPAASWLTISATRGDNLEELLSMLHAMLPLGPRLYPPDQITNAQERFIAAEIVREKALLFLRQEVPHAIAVVVNEYKERSQKLVYISATIYVERDSQKGIVLGEGGRMLKRIGQAAREELEANLGRKVYLDLWVKVRKHWRKDENALRWFGYRLPKKKK